MPINDLGVTFDVLYCFVNIHSRESYSTIRFIKRNFIYTNNRDPIYYRSLSETLV